LGSLGIMFLAAWIALIVYVISILGNSIDWFDIYLWKLVLGSFCILRVKWYWKY
jgi:hypothetical protein